MRNFVVALILLPLILGCDSNQSTSQSRVGGTTLSKEAVEKALVAGARTNELISLIGEPAFRRELGEGKELWAYNFSPVREESTEGKTALIGVHLGVTNGRLASWDYVSASLPIYHRTGVESIAGTNESDTESPQLRFFLVRNQPIAGGKAVNTERFPNLGFISETPDLTAKNLEGLRMEELKSSNQSLEDRWALAIYLNPVDTKRLAEFTMTNLSQKLLIMVDDEAIFAAEIVEPIETGSLAIEFDDKTMMESAKNQLSRMVQRN